MTQVSYSDVFAIDHARGYEEEIRAGDIVRAGRNLFPHYRVVAIFDGKAWVRDLQTGLDGITSIERCRKIDGPSAVSIAAE